MTDIVYALDFTGIPGALSQNSQIRERALALIATEPIPGKVTEGGERLKLFRLILSDFFSGLLDLGQARSRTRRDIPRESSQYIINNRVFCEDWDERLIRTQVSRFYNQAVMETLIENGETLCHVPHSPLEQSSSNCSMMLAGRNHDLRTLYGRLIESYSLGNWAKIVKIPDHPHCTHVVIPSK